MKFTIELQRDNLAEPDEPRGVRIAAGEVVFTRLLRPGQDGESEFMQAPPAQLAFWVVDNWWRLRWEGPHGQATADWRLAHDLSAIGGGYAWPRLTLWGVDNLMECHARADPAGVVGPVRYVTTAQVTASAASFEEAVDGFMEEVLDRSGGITGDAPPLEAQWRALLVERVDPDVSAWRRLEARLGYDQDKAPPALMEQLARLAEQFDADGVEEAAMATPGPGAADALDPALAYMAQAHEAEPVIERILGDPARPLWLAAEWAAAELRRGLGIADGPVRNRDLGDLLSTRNQAFRAATGPGSTRPYGLRLADRETAGRQRLYLHTRSHASRRFEAARALGDAQWARGARSSRLGPIGWADTARQRFQRAFAQALLCPYEELSDYLGGGEIDDDQIDAAARRYEVTEGVIRTLLVNKGRIARDRLPAPAGWGQNARVA
jgi:hypothetical protein